MVLTYSSPFPRAKSLIVSGGILLVYAVPQRAHRPRTPPRPNPAIATSRRSFAARSELNWCPCCCDCGCGGGGGGDGGSGRAAMSLGWRLVESAGAVGHLGRSHGVGGCIAVSAPTQIRYSQRTPYGPAAVCIVRFCSDHCPGSDRAACGVRWPE